MSIMVFDSGVGGLTVASEIRKKLPHIPMAYVSDNGYFPYGEKNVEQLKTRVLQIVKKSINTIQPTVIIIACNTASTVALPLLRQEISIPIVGVVPAIKPAALLSKNNLISVISTHITASSDYIETLINTYAQHCQVIVSSTECLVKEAENKVAGQPVNLNTIKNKLEEIHSNTQVKKPDVLVLACTHFPLLKQEISCFIPNHTHIIDSGKAIAERVHDILTTNNTDINTISNTAKPTIHLPTCHYYMTAQSNLNTLCKSTVESWLHCTVNFKYLR